MKPTTISQRGEDYRRLESTTDDHTKKNDNCIQPRKKCYLLISIIFILMFLVALVFLYGLIVLGNSNRLDYFAVVCNFITILLFSVLVWKM